MNRDKVAHIFSKESEGDRQVRRATAHLTRGSLILVETCYEMGATLDRE